jgi:hypothetical protein
LGAEVTIGRGHFDPEVHLEPSSRPDNVRAPSVSPHLAPEPILDSGPQNVPKLALPPRELLPTKEDEYPQIANKLEGINTRLNDLTTQLKSGKHSLSLAELTQQKRDLALLQQGHRDIASADHSRGLRYAWSAISQLWGGGGHMRTLDGHRAFGEASNNLNAALDSAIRKARISEATQRQTRLDQEAENELAQFGEFPAVPTRPLNVEPTQPLRQKPSNVGDRVAEWLPKLETLAAVTTKTTKTAKLKLGSIQQIGRLVGELKPEIDRLERLKTAAEKRGKSQLAQKITDQINVLSTQRGQLVTLASKLGGSPPK